MGFGFREKAGQCCQGLLRHVESIINEVKSSCLRLSAHKLYGLTLACALFRKQEGFEGEWCWVNKIIKMDSILDTSYFKNTIKDKYSFPKSNRFPEIKSHYTIDYFDPSSSVNSQRSTSFGFGNKYDFFKQRTRSPGPFQYSKQESLNSTRTISFGVGRDKVIANSYIDAEKAKTPSAGMYEDGSLKFKKKSPSCLMTTRRPGDSFITTSDVPEAGKYSPVDTFYSRRRSSSQFGFGSSKRFNYSLMDKKGVGPGSYEPNDKPKPPAGTIGHAKRKTYAVEELEKSISPGPKYYVN